MRYVFTGTSNHPLGLKLVVLALIWAYLHDFIAGLRHVWMDVSHKAVSREFGKFRRRWSSCR